jgi:hypothetical protein
MRIMTVVAVVMVGLALISTNELLPISLSYTYLKYSDTEGLIALYVFKNSVKNYKKNTANLTEPRHHDKLRLNTDCIIVHVFTPKLFQIAIHIYSNLIFPPIITPN